MKLTDTKCKAVKPKEKPYKIADGGGLYLEVMPSGSKCWRLKYRIHGKEKRLALGVYDRAQFLDERTTMMQEWADYLDAVASGGKVIVGNFKSRNFKRKKSA